MTGSRASAVLRRIATPFSVTSILAVCVSPPAAGQEATCVHERLNAFQFMAGEWDVHAETRLGDGRWEQSLGRSVVRPLFGDRCVLVEAFTGMRDGRQFGGRGTIGFNAVRNVLQFEWIDSEHGMLTTFEGELRGDTLMLDYQMVLRGTPVTLRQVFFDIQERSFRHEDQRSADDGRTWDVSGRARYVRRGN